METIPSQNERISGRKEETTKPCPNTILSRKGTIISVLRIPQLLHNVSIEYILSPTGRVYIVRAALSHGSYLLLRYDYLISAAVIPCRTFRKSCISFPPEAQRMGIPKPR